MKKRPHHEQLGVHYDADPRERRLYGTQECTYQWLQCQIRHNGGVCGREFSLYYRRGEPMDCEACCAACEDACPNCGEL